MKSETIMLTIALALAIAIVGGLVVVPAIDQQVHAAPKQGLLGTKKECRDTVLQGGETNRNASLTCNSLMYN